MTSSFDADELGDGRDVANGGRVQIAPIDAILDGDETVEGAGGIHSRKRYGTVAGNGDPNDSVVECAVADSYGARRVVRGQCVRT